jgi:serine/threonine-protein kinase
MHDLGTSMMDMELYPIRPDELTPGTLVENWRVLQSLGRWGHGATYRVEDVRNPGNSLALRMSLRHGEGRFDEWTARLRTSHPNVVRLHAYGRWPRPRNGYFYFVRDYVRGRGLPTWVETINPTFLQVVALMNRLSFAIDDIHGRDTWHRDIRPDNIRVRDEDGEPVVLDLRAGGNEGVDTLTQVPLPAETLVYRSPEALRFLRMNWGRKGLRYHFQPTDDVYALGATAYWLVTGHPPFSPRLPIDQLHSEIELRMPPSPWEVNERVPRVLGALILKCLAKNPEARPRNGEVLNAELMAASSAGARSVWASRVFTWAPEGPGQEGSARRILRPTLPQISQARWPRVPWVMHFKRPERMSSPAESPPWKPRFGRGMEPREPIGPWSRMM